MSSLFKTATAGTIRKLLKTTPTALTNYDKMPNNYLIDKQENSARAEYKFGDFKEAFCYLNLIAQTCSQFDYHPEIYNVYNRITIKLYTKNESQQKVVTQRQLYVSHLINELVSQKIQDAHQKTLQKVQKLL